NTYNSLIASAFFLLLYNPYFLFDISFQLSYAGLLGILYFHPYIFGWGQLKFQLISEYYLLNQIWSLTAVSLAAMLTTTPLSLYYFHQFPGSFWISGLIVVPLATLVLYAGLFLFAISKFFLFAYWVGKFLELVILGMNYSLSCIEKIPPGVIRDFWLERNETALWYLVVALLAAALHERRIIWLKYGLFLTVILGMKFNLSVFFARQQHFIVFYEAGREILIDVFKGKEVLSVKSSEISDKQIQFAAYNNRIAHQIARTDVQYLSIVDSLPKTKVLNIEGYSLLLLSDEHQVDLIPPNTFFKYILIYDNPRLDFELLQNKVKFSKIVIAADNTLKSLQFYKKECLARGIPCHDIKLDGTLVEAFDE
ncbi:MAG: ComEC/Rec2 family competence protein, partial [Saprospiraceae bacterium]